MTFIIIYLMWKLQRWSRRYNQSRRIQRLIQFDAGKRGRRRLDRRKNSSLITSAPVLRNVQQIRIVIGIREGVIVSRRFSGVVRRHDDRLGLPRRRRGRGRAKVPKLHAVDAAQHGQLVRGGRGREIVVVLGKA